jgi:quercetin dioxygenase-like cupin family protein
MNRSRIHILWLVSVISVAMTAGAAGGDAPGAAAPGTTAPSQQTYPYATNGILERVDPAGDQWKLLLNESNLGGKELEAAEVTLPAGTMVRSHTHGSVEVIYVLSGVYGHEVNGKLYLLKPGMIGIVRPGDHVRHLVPKDGPAKILIVWAPPGEAAKLFPPGVKGVTPAPVAEAKALDP